MIVIAINESNKFHLKLILIFSLMFEAFEPRSKTAIGDLYSDFDKYKKTGAPTPLPDRPIISKMSDRRLTLCWKPSVSVAPRVPVTYQVEMLELPEGNQFINISLSYTKEEKKQ